MSVASLPRLPVSSGVNLPTTSTAFTLVHAVLALSVLRILSSYSWLSGALVGKDAKLSGDFLAGPGLVERITAPGGFAQHALTPGVAAWLTDTVVPHASLFAWLIALGELGVGLSLLLGLFTRLGGVFAIVQALVNIAVAGGGGADTIGHNYMLIVVSLACIYVGAGRSMGLDAAILRRFPDTPWLRLAM